MLINGVSLCHMTSLCVINNGYLIKPLVLSMKWKWWLHSFLDPEFNKKCQNLAWHLFSRLPSYFENHCHECPTYGQFLQWVLRFEASHTDWLLSAHVVVQTWNMHTDVMTGVIIVLQCSVVHLPRLCIVSPCNWKGYFILMGLFWTKLPDV